MAEGRATLAPPPPGDWFGQPRGLTILFLTDMWEQFSFYGMRALLVLYMVKALGFAQARASMIYGLYAAGVFFTPIVGGWIADRWLGRRLAVVIGGATMAAGHFMMAVPSLFFPALATIACGNGLFLPSLPSQIDELYARDDPRRRSAYNVFYVGINLGGFLAPLVVGTLAETLGWHVGFGAAGAGMLLSLLVYLAGGRHLPREARVRTPRVANAPAQGPPARRALIQRFVLLGAVAGCVVVFRGAYEQLGNTVSLVADAGVDRTVGGWTVPATWFQSLNPLMIMLLTPFYVSAWNRQAARGREPSSLAKMATGAVVLACAFLALAAMSAWGEARHARPSWIWLAACLTLITAGELFILPVGLGLFGRLAPAGLSATTIAVWFFAGFFGNLLAGWVGEGWSRVAPSVFFTGVAGLALASAGLLAVLIRPARRAERGE